MAYKRPFDDVMREFTAKYPDEVEQITPEQLAERTGYSLAIAREYLDHRTRAKEDAAIRAKESNAVTYVTSSGKANVVYYPLIGEVQITSTHDRRRPNSWSDPRKWGEKSLLLSPQDTIEIGIYLLGLQPHIRDVLARKEQAVPPSLTEEPEIAPEQESDRPESEEL